MLILVSDSKYMRRVTAWRDRLAAGDTQYVATLEHLREDLVYGHIALESIGLTEELLETYRVRGCEALARHYLNTVRRGVDAFKDVQQSDDSQVMRTWLMAHPSNSYTSFLGYVRAQLKLGGLPLTAIETTGRELRYLERMSAVIYQTIETFWKPTITI